MLVVKSDLLFEINSVMQDFGSFFGRDIWLLNVIIMIFNELEETLKGLL